jgi:hypothetical protein
MRNGTKVYSEPRREKIICVTPEGDGMKGPKVRTVLKEKVYKGVNCIALAQNRL